MVHDRGVQVAAVGMTAGPSGYRRTTAYTTRIDPRMPIPPAASAVHGIRDRDVVGAPVFAAVLPDLLAVVAGQLLITYNGADFDVPLLLNEAGRCGRRRDAVAALRSCRLVDVMLYTGPKQAWKSRTLSEQCRRRSISFTAHDAGADAEATAWLALAMVREGLIESLEAAAEEQAAMWTAIVR